MVTAMNLNDGFGERLRLARKNAHIKTDQQLADLLGVNRSTVTRWKSLNTPDMTIPTVKDIAKKLGVNVEWLAFGTGSPYLKMDHAIETRILAVYRTIKVKDPHLLGTIITMLDSLEESYGLG